MRWAVALLAVSLAACTAVATPAPAPKLGISNGTTLIVTLTINGQRIVDVPPGDCAP